MIEQLYEFVPLILFLKEAGVASLITRCIAGQLIVADFPDFKKSVKRIFLDVRDHVSASRGNNADYIPQLNKKNTNPNTFGVSICTIDGQRFNLGDAGEFCIQSCINPFVYALALQTRGIETVHSFIGTEPSNLPFNALQLNKDNRPHNPMINSGAIIAGALICPKLKISDKFERMLKVLKRACGGKVWGFDNSVYQSEKEIAETNYALAYMVLPPVFLSFSYEVIIAFRKAIDKTTLKV
jgi:glutaminase